ncbi:MAG: DMT family transporter [Candidatus Micrarchaeota archaeon]|nr:DMT family transporter [Candidatus Micrarchaeota archaeon]
MKIKTKAQIYLVISLLTGSLMPIMLAFGKSVNIFEFFMLAYLFSIPFAYLLVRQTNRVAELREYLNDKKRLALVVLIGFLSYIPIGFSVLYSEHFITASLATAIFRTSPLLMLIFLPTILKERLSRNQIIALLLAFVGLYIAITGGNLWIFSNPNLGIILFMALSALGYALSSVLGKKYVFNMESGILIFNTSLFLLFAGLFVLTGASFSAISIGELLAILFISIANNIVGFYTFFSAFRVLKTTLVTNVYFLAPFMSFIFADLFLGEPIQPYYLAIAGLVVAGLLIQRVDKLGGTYHQSSKQATIFDVTSAFVNSEEARISHIIKNGGKVLAVKVDARHRASVDSKVSAHAAKANLFTDLHDAIKTEERAFINEIMGVEATEMFLLSAGDPSQSEESLNQIVSELA